MTAAEWIGLATLCAMVLIAVVGAAWKQGRDAGEIKAMLASAIERFNRGDKKFEAIDKKFETIEIRLNDHTERITRVEARKG